MFPEDDGRQRNHSISPPLPRTFVDRPERETKFFFQDVPFLRGPQGHVCAAKAECRSSAGPQHRRQQ
ncbi:unnamed protein product [Ectocarpus sp. 12 AP-2014]